MARIFGWLGPAPENVAPEAVLRTVCGAPQRSTLLVAGDGYGVAVRDDAGSDVRATDGIVAAVSGTPRWTSSELQSVAARDGNGQALAAGFLRYGRAVLNHLQGSFAIALLEPRAHRALLAIDRLGTQPLAYQKTDDGIVFGSSTDSVLSHGSSVPQIDPRSVYAYLYFHMVPSPWTIYQHQAKLTPAESIAYERGAVTSAQYWRPDFNSVGDASIEALAVELHRVLRQAVARTAPDAHTGAFLSGGIDSSTLAGLLGEQLGQSARTYSIGFEAQGYDEMRYANIAAERFSTKHHEYYVTPADVVASVQSICASYDEPFGNASVVPAYCCAKMARADGVRLMVAGDGGDELFAGNVRYATQKLFAPYNRIPRSPIKSMFERLVSSLPMKERVAPFRKLKNYIEQANTPLPDRLQSYNFLERARPTDVFAADLLAEVDTDSPLGLFRERYADSGTDSELDSMLYLDWKFTLADNDIRKVAKACELAGVPVCFPFLDDDVVEFSTRVPPQLKLKGTQLRYFFKEAMRGFLPDEILKKSKHGFGLPFGVWLRNDSALQELAYDSLRALKRHPYFRPAFIDDVVHMHRRGHAAFYGGVIWVLMALALWLEAHPAGRKLTQAAGPTSD